MKISKSINRFIFIARRQPRYIISAIRSHKREAGKAVLTGGILAGLVVISITASTQPGKVKQDFVKTAVFSAASGFTGYKGEPDQEGLINHREIMEEKTESALEDVVVLHVVIPGEDHEAVEKGDEQERNEVAAPVVAAEDKSEIIHPEVLAEKENEVEEIPARQDEGSQEIKIIPKEWFDDQKYAEANPDVVAALGTSRDALWGHYEMFGANEGREVFLLQEPITELVKNETTESVLTKSKGRIQGPSGEETWYNRDMSGVIKIMRSAGYNEGEYPYWVRGDGCKMIGNYVMVAANLNSHPRGSVVKTSLGEGMVCDTGWFCMKPGHQDDVDIAVNW